MNTRKLLMVITPLFFLITAYLIIESFGLFESNHISASESTIGAWTIQINNFDVSGAESTFEVDNFVWVPSPYVKDGKVAPGMEGYFDILIDPNGTDVSIRYDIEFDFSLISNDQFAIDGVSETLGHTLTRTGENTYTGVIFLSNIDDNVTNNIRVAIRWVNDENNNDADSALIEGPNTELEIPVSITVSQYTGEIITEYVNE